MEEFLKDIEPFFYGKRMTYVDVGAHVGSTFEAVRKSKFRIGEAHLIEPNPASFSKLRERATTLVNGKNTTLHNIALGASQGVVQMRAADTMTKVIALLPDETGERTSEQGMFDVPLTTLDALSSSFMRKHISLLKIDVEGFEEQVLNGASDLLKSEAIDVIYAEAGFNPDNKQQCYYRKIEDILAGYGYRVFRIYEQKNEWLDDSPALRRVNMAFMSRRFSVENPMRLTNELFDARREAAKLKEQLAKAEARRRAMLESMSWRFTAPMRAMGRAIRSLTRSKKAQPGHAPAPKSSDDHGSDLRRVQGDVKKRGSAHVSGANIKPLLRKAASLKQVRNELPRYLNRSLKKKIGRSLGSMYASLPASTRAAIPQSVKRWAKERMPSVASASPLVKAFDDKLWGGFSRSALIDLAAIKANEALPAGDRAEACYSLARWHAVQGDFSAALKEMEDRRAINPKIAHQKRQYMLEARFLCRLGRAEEARTLVERYSAGKPFDTSVQLMLANTWNPAVTGVRKAEGEAKVLEYINTVYRHFGLAEIEKRDPVAALSIDNLRGKDVKKHFDPDNKVTVIVPAYNAEGTILTALTSLAEQSCQNLEILVVDDCSTDNTAAVVEAFCKTDERFRLIRQRVNGGSYACRNRALEEARGAYITIHDSDDFAHPDRIYCHLMESVGRNCKYNLSNWARTQPDLVFVGVWRPEENLTSLNMGSFFVHRSIFNTVGPWDNVRVSGDREFIRRVETFCGGKNRRMMAKGCPLVFGRVSETSLTQTKETSVSTVYNGIRREYHEAFDYIHQKYSPEMASEFLLREELGVASPGVMRSQREARSLDVLFIGDWNMQGGTFHSAKNMISAAVNSGMRVGVLNCSRYDYDVSAPLRHDLRAYFYGNNVSIISAGEPTFAKNVVVTYPALLHHPMDRFPKIEHEKLFVVVNQMAERDNKAKDIAYDPALVRRHLVEFFGHEGHWVPISNWVRKIMEEDPRYPQPQKNTWTPMVDLDEWMIDLPRWRGKVRDLPVIGRHGRDHPLKWPGNRTALLDAYCAGKPCELRFLGGARHAERLAGGWPANWQVHPFGSRDVKEFLADLDFFIHYPHEDYIEEFGRAPMEAMAIGVPVILPPVFRETFGEAALYAEPADVWPLIEKLWADEKKWLDRVEAGREFVKKNCSYDAFPPRLQ